MRAGGNPYLYPDPVVNTVVVTGGSSGIGAETARALAGAGARVVLAVRDMARGERVVPMSRLTPAGERVTWRMAGAERLGVEGGVPALISWDDPATAIRPAIEEWLPAIG